MEFGNQSEDSGPKKNCPRRHFKEFRKAPFIIKFLLKEKRTLYPLGAFDRGALILISRKAITSPDTGIGVRCHPTSTIESRGASGENVMDICNGKSEHFFSKHTC